MFCANKNSYLQLTSVVDPKLVNKAVRHAMRQRRIDPHDELPAAHRLESMQPSLFGPWVDITRTRMGFGRIGLRIVNRDLSSDDNTIQLQAIHTLLDQVQIMENALFLINLNVTHRLIDLMTDEDPIIREKVTRILTHLAKHYQGKMRIMSRPIIINHLIEMFTKDLKEIRYAAAHCLETLTRDRCSCEKIMQNENIIKSLVMMIKNEHMGMVVFHLNSLKNLSAWDPVQPLKANAFQVMRQLIKLKEYKIVQAALDCLAQLCKHSIGKKLADQYDLTQSLYPKLLSESIDVIISALSVMAFTTTTAKEKWRAREKQRDLIKSLVTLCVSYNVPPLQLHAMQVLINLAEIPDIRTHMKNQWGTKIKNIKISSHEQWDGTTDIAIYGFETSHHYRTMCIGNVETVKNDLGDNVHALNAHTFLSRVQEVKARLVKTINTKPYRFP